MEGCLTDLFVGVCKATFYLMYGIALLLYRGIAFLVRKIQERSLRRSSTIQGGSNRGSDPVSDTSNRVSVPVRKRPVTGLRAGLMCPGCLERDCIRKHDQGKRQYFSCTDCSASIPAEYVNETGIEREVISAVGFRGHGKTMYFGSLFYTIDDLAKYWPGFYTFALDETSLDVVREISADLKAGKRPKSTGASFHSPTIVRLSNIPGLGDRFLLFYDTGGESYTNANRLIQHARFVRNSRTVIFIVSLDVLEKKNERMNDLLSVYVQGLNELEGKTEDQHLIVVLSQGDKYQERLRGRDHVWRYLQEGTLEELGNEKLGRYINGMKVISDSLRSFVRDDLGEAQFLNFATTRFRSVEFSIVSALGADPVGDRLQFEIVPKRIMDPILWVMYKSLGFFRRVHVGGP